MRIESLGVIVFYHMGIMENAVVVITAFRMPKKKKKKRDEVVLRKSNKMHVQACS